MKSFFKKIFRFFIFLFFAAILVLGAFLVYFNYVLSQDERVEFVRNVIIKQSGLDIHFTDATLTIKGALTFHDFSLEHPAGKAGNVALDAEHVYLHFKIGALKQRKLILETAALSRFSLSHRDDMRATELRGKQLTIFSPVGFEASRLLFKNLPEGSVTLADAEITSSLLRMPLTHLDGHIDINPRDDSPLDLTWQYLNTEFTTHALIKKAPELKVAGNLSSEIFETDFEITHNDEFAVQLTKGRLWEQRFELSGPLGTNLFSPQPRLRGRMEGTLSELMAHSRIPKSPVECSGNYGFSFSCEGNSWKVSEWMTKGIITSPEAVISKVKIADFSAEAEYQRNILNVPHYSCRIFDGPTDGSMHVEFSESGTFIRCVQASQDINLNALINTYSKKKDKFSGNLDFAVEVRGRADDPASIKGLGSLGLKDGRLWKLPVFSGIPILSSIPILGTNHITDGNGAFIIEEEMFKTNNMRFKGPGVEAFVKGTVGFDTSLNLLVDIKPTTLSVQDIPLVGGVLGHSIGVVQIGGTINKPKYFNKPLSAMESFETESPSASKTQDRKTDDSPRLPVVDKILDILPF